jgi:DNA-binding LacI/PurR family transcriptional regulator
VAVTMREVAQKAGVSKATVSYVLNGRGDTMRIAPETRQRIRDAIEELGYYPNALARSLAHKQTHTVAVVMQYPALFSGWSGFTNELMHGVTDAAIEQGYDLMLHTRNTVTRRGAGKRDDVEREVDYLTDGRVDGALLLRDKGDPLACTLHERKFPAVLMFTHSVDPAIWFVDCDNIEGGRLATEHLLRLGHMRILHLAGPLRSCAGEERQIGYRQALESMGITVREDWILEVPSPLSNYSAALRCFNEENGARPTAVFAWSDDVAIQMMRLLRERNIRIPQDVAVVGFDSTALCDHTDPPLTSIRQPVYAMTRQAFVLLTQKLKGDVPLQTQIRFEPELVIRKSCGSR